jgi:choline dehydrogenase-like flavoprotein
MKVVVIGSGLGGTGAIKALVRNGHKPVVLDVGAGPPSDVERDMQFLRNKDPRSWSSDDLGLFAAQREQVSKSLVPRKSILGSEYFYGGGDLRAEMSSQFKPGFPPYSEAIGGFSAGWGGAFLPIHEDDVKDWPVPHHHLMDSMRACVSGLMVHEPIDGITHVFPSLGAGVGRTRDLSRAETRILKQMERASRRSGPSSVVVGQSRLLTDFSEDSEARCRYCGHCSSGCVFGSIYKTADEIEGFAKRDLIEYRRGLRVHQIDSVDSAPVIRAQNIHNGELVSIEADRVLVAMGAVQSSILFMRSMGIVDRPMTIRRTGGFLQPLVSLRGLPLDWPDVNTQSSVFAEFKVPEVSSNWVHAQISPANELVLRRLGIRSRRRGFSDQLLRRQLAEHIGMALVNIHSSFGPSFEVRIRGDEVNEASVESRQIFTDESKRAHRAVFRSFSRLMRSSGFVPIRAAQQGSTTVAGFHFGSSLPMRLNPMSEFETDPLGRPAGWTNVHFVDTSVLPNIPATTVGLLTMANGFRIASELQ